MNEARELVTQGDILGDEICTVLEDGSDNGESQRELEGGALADEARASWQIIASPPVSEETPKIRAFTR